MIDKRSGPLNAGDRSTPSRTSRRTFLRGLGAAGLAAGGVGGLTACGSSGAADDEATLSILYIATATQKRSWEKLFAKFREKHPQIKLVAQGVAADNWADFLDKVSTQLAGGKSPDIIQVATEGQRLFADKGLLEPLDSFIEADKAEIDEYYADLHPKLIEWSKASSSDGKTYYLPGEFNTMTLWFNRDVFEKARIDAPTPEWTWSDFEKAARKLKSRDVLAYPFTPEYFIGVMPPLLTNGTSSYTADWSRPTIDNDAAIEAAEFCRRFVAQGYSPPPGGTFDRFALAAQGKLASFGGGRWPIIDLRNAGAVDRMEIVPWPRHTDRGSPVGWNGYPILKASKNKKQAWTFIKYLISKEGSSHFAELGGTIVPGRKSVAASESFLKDSPKGTEYLYQALDYATPIPAPTKGNVIQKTIESDWQQILAGTVSPASGMRALQRKLTDLR